MAVGEKGKQLAEFATCIFAVCDQSISSHVVASSQNISLSLVMIDNEAFPSEMMSLMRSRTSTEPASPTGISISATIPDAPAAFPEAILLIGSPGPSTGLPYARSSGHQHLSDNT